MRSASWLRLEGVSALLLSVVLYAQHGRGWLFFGLLFLLPDVSMIGYLRGAGTGGLLYNLFHTYTAPLFLGATAVALDHPLLLSVSLVWAAHIAFDRALGYGLKLPSGFQDTHLGRIGRERGVVPE